MAMNPTRSIVLLRDKPHTLSTAIGWYAVYTMANREKKIAAELESRAVNSFLPLYHSVRRWKDRRVHLDLPLFPGYIFVHFSLEDRLRVLHVPGVVRLVSFNNAATPVAEAEIAAIQTILAHGLLSQPHPYLTVGRRVRIQSGPLGGLEGILVRRKNKTRFVVSVASIQRAVSVEVSESELQPLSAPDRRANLLT